MQNFQFKLLTFLLIVLATVTVSMIIAGTGASQSSLVLATPNSQFAVFQDRRPTSAGGGGTSLQSTWEKRVLNFTQAAKGPSIGLNTATSTISLAPGNYYIEASAPAFKVDRHQARLWNVTDGVTALLGTAEFSNETGDYTQSRSIVRGHVQVLGALPKEFEVQHFCRFAATSGLGVGTGSIGTGEDNVFTTVSILKVN